MTKSSGKNLKRWRDLSDIERNEQIKFVKLHIGLLKHTSDNNVCNSIDIAILLKHFKECTKPQCDICFKASNLLHVHARICDNDNCQVLYCVETRNAASILKEMKSKNDI